MKKEKQDGEDGSYHIAQIGLGDRGKNKSKNGLDLIWIEIGFFLNSRNEPTRPVMGTIFLVYVHNVCIHFCSAVQLRGWSSAA